MAIIYGFRANDSQLYFYIGSTKHELAHRVKQHQNYMRLGHNKNRHFVNKVNQLGWENVIADIIAHCDEDTRFDSEYSQIAHYLALGHPLTNIVHNTDLSHFQSHNPIASPYENYPIRLDHIEEMINVLNGGIQPSGDRLFDSALELVEKLAKHLVSNHPQYLLDTIEELRDEQSHRQATSIRERILKMLERHRSGD